MRIGFFSEAPCETSDGEQAGCRTQSVRVDNAQPADWLINLLVAIHGADSQCKLLSSTSRLIGCGYHGWSSSSANPLVADAPAELRLD